MKFTYGASVAAACVLACLALATPAAHAETLSVSVAGSGDVSYYGDPAVSRSVVGSGDIKRIALAPH